MAPKKHAANGRRYSEADKAVAVQLILSTGGVLTNENWKQVRKLLGKPVSYKAVQLWFAEYQSQKTRPQQSDSSGEVTSTLQAIDFANAATIQMVEHTLRNYAARANNPDAVKATEGKDAARVMGEMIKLMQLLQGLPTEIIGWMSDLQAIADLFREENVDGSASIRAWRQELEKRRQAKQGKVSNG